MSQRESRLSKDIQVALRGRGAFCFKVWGSEFMMVGLPDIIGCYKGKFFAFETKNPDNRKGTTTRQEYVMLKIRQAGGVAQVVCTIQEALDALPQ